MDSVEYGTLSYLDEAGHPAIRPLNFVAHKGRVYLHSAVHGEKMRAFAKHEQVSFSVVESLSLIPSYVISPEQACSATHFFLSVILQGKISTIDDPTVKGIILEELMKKLQPEGGYRSITENPEMYQKSLKAVALLEIQPTTTKAKFKLGQNLSPEKRKHLLNSLQNSQDARIARTIALIQKYTPKQ